MVEITSIVLAGLKPAIVAINSSPCQTPKGNILGVNQLFGDNTFGPDNAFSLHGFEALAKWDGRNMDYTRTNRREDDHIDYRDPIFDHLRLWFDVNHDGNVNTHREREGDANGKGRELFTLAEAGIVSI